jgi:hypothetical protein
VQILNKTAVLSFYKYFRFSLFDSTDLFEEREPSLSHITSANSLLRMYTVISSSRSFLLVFSVTCTRARLFPGGVALPHPNTLRTVATCCACVVLSCPEGKQVITPSV